MNQKQKQVLEYLKSYISAHKIELIDQALEKRTRHLTVVLEDIYQPQNASAVIRTADCFGIQDVHIIEHKHKFKLNPRVVHGSSKWVDVHQYEEERNNAEKCIQTLKEQGYKIIATVPDQAAKPFGTIDLSQKSALVFGTEMTGISDYMKEVADEQVTIPMYGFTESFNISVSVAIILNNLTEKLFSSNHDWRLNEEEKNDLRLSWYRKIVNRSDLLEKEYLKSYKDT